jgi:hypothetical protein
MHLAMAVHDFNFISSSKSVTTLLVEDQHSGHWRTTDCAGCAQTHSNVRKFCIFCLIFKICTFKQSLVVNVKSLVTFFFFLRRIKIMSFMAEYSLNGHLLEK